MVEVITIAAISVAASLSITCMLLATVSHEVLATLLQWSSAQACKVLPAVDELLLKQRSAAAKSMKRCNKCKAWHSPSRQHVDMNRALIRTLKRALPCFHFSPWHNCVDAVTQAQDLVGMYHLLDAIIQHNISLTCIDCWTPSCMHSMSLAMPMAGTVRPPSIPNH